MKYSKFLMACLALISTFTFSSQKTFADVIYSITGVANNFGNPNDPNLSPQVQAGETYVAEFRIDTATADVDPSSTRGEYAGAIIASSIEFSGGYTSMVDFTGGDIIIQQDIAGGAVGIFDPGGLGGLLLGSFTPFPSDDLLTDPGTQIVGAPLTLWSITEPDGLIVSASLPGAGPGAGSQDIVLTVNSIPEPTTAGVLALGSLGFIVRRRR